MSMAGSTITPGGAGVPPMVAEYPAVPQVLQAKTEQVSRGIRGFFGNLWDTARHYLGVLWAAGRVYWDAYPSLRTFAYIFGTLTAVPNAIFLTYAAITLAITGSIAAAGLLIVEGGILAFGMLFLAPILFVAFWIALGIAAAFTATLYALRGTAIALSTTQELTGAQSGISGATLTAGKTAAAIGANTMQSIETAVVGREGMPRPVLGRPEQQQQQQQQQRY